jgi:hypothetical protein
MLMKRPMPTDSIPPTPFDQYGSLPLLSHTIVFKMTLEAGGGGLSVPLSCKRCRGFLHQIVLANVLADFQNQHLPILNTVHSCS